MFNWKHDYHMTDVVKTNKTKISMHNTLVSKLHFARVAWALAFLERACVTKLQFHVVILTT